MRPDLLSSPIKKRNNIKIYYFFFIFILAISCKEANESRLNGSWVSDLGIGLISFDNGKLTHLGREGEYEVKEYQSLDLRENRGGHITFIFPKEKLSVYYFLDKKGQFLTLKYKEKGYSEYFTKEAHFKKWGKVQGWSNDYDKDILFPDPLMIYFSGKRSFLIRSIMKTKGKKSYLVKRLFSRLEGGPWTPFNYGEGELGHLEGVSGFYSRGDVIITGLNGKKTFLSLNAGKDFKKISDKFPGVNQISGNDFVELPKSRYVVVGDSLMAFLFHEKMLKVFRMDDIFSEGRGEWELVNTLDSGTNSSFEVYAFNEQLLLRFESIYQSFDRGDIWEEIQEGIKERKLTGQFHYYNGKILYFEKKHRKVYSWVENEKKWKLLSVNKFEAISTHATGIYGLRKGQVFRIKKFGDQEKNLGDPFLHPSFNDEERLSVGRGKIYHLKRALLARPLP
ncbi:hypothetical protein OAK75_04710 [Bacteriovoracales bacterium]|nr:hypothetical protein [Bacteriovoracales bacterium]